MWSRVLPVEALMLLEGVNQMIVLLQCHQFILSNIHHQVNQGGGASAPQHHQPPLEDCEVSPTAPPVPYGGGCRVAGGPRRESEQLKLRRSLAQYGGT